MRFKWKLLIVFVAVILSALGFYLISSPFISLHMSTKKDDTEITESYFAVYDVDKSMRIICANSYKSNSSFLCATGFSK
jgi:hypothetical protein